MEKINVEKIMFERKAEKKLNAIKEHSRNEYVLFKLDELHLAVNKQKGCIVHYRYKITRFIVKAVLGSRISKESDRIELLADIFKKIEESKSN